MIEFKICIVALLFLLIVWIIKYNRLKAKCIDMAIAIKLMQKKLEDNGIEVKDLDRN